MRDRRKIGSVSGTEPQQLELIPDPDLWGVDVGSLKRECAALRSATRSAATLRAWEGDWKHFSDWCTGARRKALPATEETVELYLAHYAAEHKFSTLQRRLSSIATIHRLRGEASPVGDEVRSVVEGLRRRKGGGVSRKAALTPEQLLEISRELDDSPRGQRDRALLVLGFASGCRRSELAALQLADVRFASQGLALTIRKSKTDQHAAGREIGVFRGLRAETCPIRTLKAWLRVRGGRESGPLFNRMDRGVVDPQLGITGESINEIVQAAVQLIGLDPREYGAHSLRAGMVTAAHASGASDSAIMQRSGHKSVQTLTQYIRHADPFRGGDVLREAL